MVSPWKVRSEGTWRTVGGPAGDSEVTPATLPGGCRSLCPLHPLPPASCSSFFAPYWPPPPAPWCAHSDIGLGSITVPELLSSKARSSRTSLIRTCVRYARVDDLQV